MTNQNNLPALFGDKKELSEMTSRLINAMPGTTKLAPGQAAALAQISLAHGLDPFNGEAWYIPGSGVMVGIKGLRKSAKRQVRKEGGADATYWVDFDRVVDNSKYEVDANHLVIICELKDTITLNAWSDIVGKFKAMGFPLEEAAKMAGPAPVTTGIGIVKPNEKSKMNRVELCRKRAEAHAIKQRFDVDFLIDVMDQTPNDLDYITEAAPIPETGGTGHFIEAELIPEFTEEAIEFAIANSPVSNEDSAIDLLSRIEHANIKRIPELKIWFQHYSNGIDQDHESPGHYANEQFEKELLAAMSAS